ncbi:hypothetical protein SDC9_95508 [bioreactor metagenome]|uniref:Uncharacterized protein n=1 Tax=bioreactor metagenome TaxID=1076179 RepID=A0A645A934_9ZZZZ
MVNAAVAALHFKQPVELKADFVEDIGNAVSALGNGPVVTECLWRGPKRQKHIGNGFTSGHNISSVIACVVPTAGYVEDCIRMEHTSRRDMACRVGILSRKRAAERDAAALQVKHSSNGFDEGLRKQRVLGAAERQGFAFGRVVEDGGNILRGYAFHK